ncbi:MAG: septum formation initiator family protein [Bacteroidales bacterium]|nr:septum formation initiator family protein [Bacteroidales bacterium]
MSERRKKKDEDGLPFWKYAIVATVVIVLLLLVIPAGSIPSWIKSGFEIRSQKRQMENYREEIDGLSKRIEDLSTDKDSLEKFAREQFGFTEPGEDVYKEE